VAREAAGNLATPGSAAGIGHAAPPAHATEPSPAVEIATANGAGHPGTVASPIVGIAYLAAQPGAAPFVRVGDVIGAGETLLIIEAMKVMNQIRAPRAGRVSRIFVEDAQPVEYGAALMLIE
jgi:acetyl-CoA carboxylase biotin carboxyl carrier protein